jgi:hypothetical protein
MNTDRRRFRREEGRKMEEERREKRRKVMGRGRGSKDEGTEKR